MDILTVTCNRDFEQMLLQAESINAFVKPCTHWVVINEPAADVDYWKDRLAPYYKNHALRLTVWDWSAWPDTNQMKIDSNYKGYKLQQVIKLMMHSCIQKDYVCLDSKNFFIAPTDIKQFTGQIGSGRYVAYSSMTDIKQKHNFEITTAVYSQKLQVPFEVSHLAGTTPFVIDHSVLTEIEPDLLQWFYQEESVNASEFTLYGFMLTKQGIDIGKATKQIADYTVWRKHWVRPEEFTVNTFLQFIDSRQYCVLGLGRDFLNQLNQEEFSTVNKWLASRGLCTQLPYQLKERYTNTKGWIQF
jgi:hypothetical protein